MKRPALQNKQVALLRMAFRARKVLGTLEKQDRGENDVKDLPVQKCNACASRRINMQYESFGLSDF